MVCQRAHFDARWFRRWQSALAGSSKSATAETLLHRKSWEWSVIAQALASRGMLQPGRRGCGFAVGREPLASLFAARGVDVLATDLAADAQDAVAWREGGQHAADLAALFCPDLIDRASFDAHVTFLPQDMRALDTGRLGTFDFIWSACSFEHLGDLEAGLRFVLDSTDLLRPGGIAVHTTEINLSSLEDTIETGGSVIYRQRDIRALEARLREFGCALEPPDFDGGTAPEDIEYDVPPYYEHGRHHIKLLLDGYVTTSMLLIIHKGRTPPQPRSNRPILTTIKATAPAPNPELDALRTELALLRAHVIRLETSRSWRLTAPLRRTASLLRGA
jgi:2-polyprenyl-3-methyl-5-hydroxy-6-metoxy-1,4-benzoquinol methylase